jgi:hypothetical protein
MVCYRADCPLRHRFCSLVFWQCCKLYIAYITQNSRQNLHVWLISWSFYYIDSSTEFIKKIKDCDKIKTDMNIEPNWITKDQIMLLFQTGVLRPAVRVYCIK